METMTPRIPTPAPPRILLVEDDAASRAFLGAAAAALPARVVAVAGCTEALEAAGDGTVPFDLWLLDAQLGDGDGIDLLARLRALHPGVPALAHTASRDDGVLARLRDAGFEAVVSKPMPAAALREAVRVLLGDDGSDWNDEAALAALNGNAAHVRGLRKLFRAELPGQAGVVIGALRHGDVATALSMLHRLRAGCGFVGATRLADAVQVLEASPRDALALARFETAVDALAGGPGSAATAV
jgi:CheY-like chemotaxis protein/HPt (histidine-containing phosphotransfer) domain-containing protein